MSKFRNYFLIIIIFLLIIAALVCSLLPKPQPPIVTPTVIVTTEVPVVTETPIITEVPTVIPTITSTPTPTKTPTPQPTKYWVEVKTGYEDGWLHYRYGPGKAYYPMWKEKQGAVQEGTQLEFLNCADTEFSWVKVIYKEIVGYVSGYYLKENPCLTNQE